MGRLAWQREGRRYKAQNSSVAFQHSLTCYGEGVESCPFQARFADRVADREGRFPRCYSTQCVFLQGCVMLKKPVQGSGRNGDSEYCTELQVDYPTLADFLCQASWGKDDPREVGSIVLFCESGRLKASINDKAMGKVAFLTFDGPDTFWAQLEKHLAADSLDWRDSQSKKKDRR